MKTIWIEETGSTNTWLRERSGALESGTMVVARRQTAGRGQRGNSWESEPGKNLTFSIYVEPEGVRPAEQFAVSEAAALAITDTLADYGIEAKVKWPNDIYVADRKICGILIENSIMGTSITGSIIGAGLNVNQTRFESDAPNPVSMAMTTGREYPLEEVAARVAANFRRRWEQLGDKERLHGEYKSRLWRGAGELHPFREAGSGREFKARIKDVELSGLLVVEDEEGAATSHAFKEIQFVLDRQ